MELNFLKRFKRSVPVAQKQQPVTPSKRSFDAAMGGRLLSDWNILDTTPNVDLQTQMAKVRARARDLANNDGYAKKFIQLCKTNVIGADGFKLQVKARDLTTQALDIYANNLLEASFKDWAKKNNCTVTGDMTFRQVQETAIAYLVRDGECFIRKVYNKSKHGFQLQLIEPDLIDETYSAVLTTGHIALGIEYDANGKVVAYYMRKVDPRAQVYGQQYTSERVRIPADKMYHIYLKERAMQSRGISWFAQSMLRLHQLKSYEEASLINARAGASKMGFITSNSDGAPQYVGDGKDENGNIHASFAPGTIEQLPAGMDFKQFNPEFPQAQYTAYVTAILRGISSGLNVSYNGLANDLTGVNFSSIRAGLVEERNYWLSLQSFFIDAFLNDVFEDWLEAAFLNGQTGTLPVSKFDKFNAPVWTGRRWSYVNPVDDINANILAINAGLKTRTQALAEQGIDYEDLLEEVAHERELELAYGVEFNATINPQSGGTSSNDEDPISVEDNMDGEGKKNGSK